MCKISCPDLFNFTWVCDYHIKLTETRQLVNTCRVNQENALANANWIDDSNLTISSHETQLNDDGLFLLVICNSELWNCNIHIDSQRLFIKTAS